ncbi:MULTISPECIES: gas vesicle protein [unclassified Streptomyces]|uniref:gas vesicle protein n=1 Tax=unclassified Streptomyces TaxID=2593676 RepID=UPI0005ECF6D7|nr:MULTISPECIES: gas vesicle protein [unclassified Streptomyces]APU38948.1 gas vesicle synthesis protein [Streptomyces sp. TN58]
MTDPLANRLGPLPSRATPMSYPPGSSSASLADILERVLDKGIVIAGDIRINLLDIELLTIKLRILIASVDKAKEMGIDWWEYDPSLSSRHSGSPLAEENRRLRAEVEALRRERLGTGEPGARYAGEAEGETAREEDRPARSAAERNRPAP